MNNKSNLIIFAIVICVVTMLVGFQYAIAQEDAAQTRLDISSQFTTNLPIAKGNQYSISNVSFSYQSTNMCVPSSCKPNAVVFTRDLENLSPNEISDLETLGGCIVHSNHSTEELLGGNATPITFFKPLTDIPIMGPVFESIRIVEADKWALEIVKWSQGKQSLSDVAWIILKDKTSDEFGKILLGNYLKSKGIDIPEPDINTINKLVLAPLLGEITDAIEETASEWINYYQINQSWPYTNLQICTLQGGLECFPNYWEFSKKYIEAKKYLNETQILSCTKEDIPSHNTLNPPILLTPVNGSVTSSRPNFDWVDVSNATSYRLDISQNVNFANVEIGSELTQSSFTLGGDLQSGKTYYWRVFTQRGDEISNPSATWSFTVQSQPQPPKCTINPEEIGVILYSEQNYNEQEPNNGRCTHLLSSHPDLGQLSVGDNAVSSIRINGNYRVKLYGDINYGGPPEEVNQNDPNLDIRSLGEQYSSIKIIPTSDCDKDADGVILYSGTGYEGACTRLLTNEPDLGRTEVGDDEVSSVRINGDYKLTLFEDKDFKERSDEINHDEPNLDTRTLGNQYSSARIEATNIKCDNTSRPGVYLYSEKKYKGNCYYTVSDIPDFDLTPITNDHLRSVWIVGSFEVKIYKDKQYGEPHVRFSHSRDDLTVDSLGDQYSSIQVSHINTAPNAPIPVSPPNNATLEVGQIPLLCWQSGGDPDGDALAFQVRLHQGDQILESSNWQSDLCWQPASFTVGAYVWDVQARDTQSVTSNWSMSYNFTINLVSPPNPDNKQAMIDQARQRLVNELGVSIDIIELVSIESVEWQDTSYGCPEPGKFYAFVITPGYIIILRVNNTTYIYHTGTRLNGPIIRCDSLSPPLGIHLRFLGPTSVASSQTFSVTVQAQGVPDIGLYGAQLDINYDPTMVSAGNVQVNPDFTFAPRSRADNANGKIEFVASRQGDKPGLTGDVTLLTFDLTVASNASGETTLTFDNEIVGDTTATALDIVSQDYTVSIKEPPSTTNTISGQVTLHGRKTNWSGATVTIDDSGQSATTDAAGNFNIPNVALGSHTSITADAPGYLPAVCNGPNITAPETSLTIINLLSGDLDDDGKVDITDATTIGANIGLADPTPLADINRDGVVDILDIILLTLNYNQGVQSWNCLEAIVGVESE